MTTKYNCGRRRPVKWFYLSLLTRRRIELLSNDGVVNDLITSVYVEYHKRIKRAGIARDGRVCTNNNNITDDNDNNNIIGSPPVGRIFLDR